MATLARITLYPIKSLDGTEVDNAQFAPWGGLTHDRQFAVIDEYGRYVNGKRCAQLHRIRTAFDLESNVARFRIDDQPEENFHLLQDRPRLEKRLTEYLGLRVLLQYSDNQAFPDDLAAPGPTLVSEATLGDVAGWFTNMNVAETRRRFRANIEIGAVEPFWEDCLVDDVDKAVRFRIGDVELLGINPCQRCVVPTRDSRTGTVDSGFASRFAMERKASLPAQAPLRRFDHFYRLAVNTMLVPGRQPGRIRVGDPVSILGVEAKPS